MTDDLKQAARDGARWTALSQIGAGACQWAQLFWLARLLPTADFGLMAIAQSSVGILAPMTDLGLSQAVVQQKHLEKRQLDTLFWLNAAIGLVLFAAFAAVGWGAARFYARQELSVLMQFTAVVFLLYPLAAQPSAMLTRSLDFRSLAVAEVVSWAFSFGISVFLAKRGWGAFALAAGHVGRYSVAAASSWWLARRICPAPALQFDWKGCRPLVRFGLFDAGARWLGILQLNIDRFVLGKWLGMGELGLYSLAWSVVQAPITRVFPIVSKVAAPVFSKIQHTDAGRLSAGYTRVMTLTLSISLPIFLAISLISSELIEIFFGEKWLAAAPALSILAGVGLVRSLGSPGASLLLARGRPEPNLWWNGFWAVFTLGWTAAWMLFRPTATGAAWAQLTGILAIGWLWHWAIRRFGAVGYARLGRTAAGMVAAAVPAVLLCFAVEKMGWPLAARFAAKSAIFAALGFFLVKKNAPAGLPFFKKQPKK